MGMVNSPITSELDSQQPLVTPFVRAFLPELIDFRRAVHRNPEL